MNLQGKSSPSAWCMAIFVFLLTSSLRLMGAEPAGAFDAANKLYEQGRYPEAAAAYERLLDAGHRSQSVYFNVGNAWFKAGQMGRAIAAWRMGEQLAPRDPDVRFNLRFAHHKVTGSEAFPRPAWQRALLALTLNEWTAIATAALWLWFALLALREWRLNWRGALGGYTATAGIAALVLVGCVATAAHLRYNEVSAVVVVPEAIARSGPLDEARVMHQFRDGVEVTVIDEKEFTVGEQRQSWLQVRDFANRTGWLKRDQVIVLRPAVRAHSKREAFVPRERTLAMLRRIVTLLA